MDVQSPPEDFFEQWKMLLPWLDWFLEGWFYTTDYVDIGIKDVGQFYVSPEPGVKLKEYLDQWDLLNRLGSNIYFEDFFNDSSNLKDGSH